MRCGLRSNTAAETSGNVKTLSFAPLGMLLFVPVGQIGAIAALGVACVILAVCDVVAFVRGGRKKEIPAEQPAQEPAAAEEEPVPEAETVIGEQPAAETAVLKETEQEIAVAAPDDEEDEEDDPTSFEKEDEERDVIIADSGSGMKKILIRYNFSFLARLIQSPLDTKARYGVLADEIASYKGLKSKIGWKQQRIYTGRNTVAYLLFKGKKLCMAFALDPAEYSETKYRGKDMSHVKRFAKTPLLLKITSERKVRYAEHLLAAVCAKLDVERGETVHEENSFSYRTTAELIEENLVKVMTSGETGENVQVEQADISALIREKISMREAQLAITDELAESLVEEIGLRPQAEELPARAEEPPLETPAEEMREEGLRAETADMQETSAPPAPRKDAVSMGKTKRGIVNIDSLSRVFAPNEVVNLASLRAKNIVSPKVRSIKVLARGVLDKSLIVEADDFSLDAIKMILLTGGKVRRIR